MPSLYDICNVAPGRFARGTVSNSDPAQLNLSFRHEVHSTRRLSIPGVIKTRASQEQIRRKDGLPSLMTSNQGAARVLLFLFL